MRLSNRRLMEMLALALLLCVGAPQLNTAYSQEIPGEAPRVDTGMGPQPGTQNTGLGNGMTPRLDTGLNPNLNSSLGTSTSQGNGSGSSGAAPSLTADQLASRLEAGRATDLAYLPIVIKIRHFTQPI